MDALKVRDPKSMYYVQCTRQELEGKFGSTFSVSNGLLGIRGAHPETPSWGRPEFYMAGTYAGGPPTLLGFHDPDHILAHPGRIGTDFTKKIGPEDIWTLPNLPFPLFVALTVNGVRFSFESQDVKVLSCERRLRMSDATQERTLVFRDRQGIRTRVDSEVFASFAERHLLAMRYRVRTPGKTVPIQIVPSFLENVANTAGVKLLRVVHKDSRAGVNRLEVETSASARRISLIQQYSVRDVAPGESVLELLVWAEESGLDMAAEHWQAQKLLSYEACRDAHVHAYRGEIDRSKLEFDENPGMVQGVNFGLMHLQMAFSPIAEKVGVPIKGYTGHGYRFVNFWDMDFHMFPYFLMTRPREARKLLEYRYGQLERYRENAKVWGAKGAQVPWETNTRGVEETAPWLCLQEREIHISADAAYMFKLYDDLTPDHSAMVTMGAEFTMETARFYASRLRWNEQKKQYDLPDIGCPDQYHTFADNNLFISLFARWNIQQAIALAEKEEYCAAVKKIGVTQDEVATWKKMVMSFFIHQPNEDGIIEEFDGFFAMGTDLDGICEQYCSHSQAVKQPDVLAAFGPFESLYPEEIRRKNWHYYNQRTLHGSSLSLPGMAYAAARCGLLDEALYPLSRSARMDLDDVNLDTERGVHVSGAAVAWEAIVYGFGGLTAKKEYLAIQPSLPRQWSWLTYAVHWQFRRVEVRLTKQGAEFVADATNDGPVEILWMNTKRVTVLPGAAVKVVVGEG